MEFYKYPLSKLFDIPQIVTIHYFEYGKDFSFQGESHDFWEFLCVDKGEVLVTAGSKTHLLKKGEIIFHQPNQFHSVTTNGVIAPNLVVVSFLCNSPDMAFFDDKILSLGERERSLLATVISEATDAFSTPLDNPYTRQLIKNETQKPGSEQLIKVSLEQFLIFLYRKGGLPESGSPITKSVKLKQDEETLTYIISYMETHIAETISLDQICHDNLLGRSQLQKLFRNRYHCGIIDYFCHMKINRAKELIREKNLNFTQIADCLGYNSIHYFSRQFRKITGMSPSEYALSIKAISERSRIEF